MQSVEGPVFGQSANAERILRSLPDWFGIEASLVQYIQDAGEMPTFIYRQDEVVVGFLTIHKHNQYSAEIHVVGVLPDHHRQGVGKALLAQSEEWLRNEGVEYLQVKTLGLARPDENYAETRKFYEAVGFRPLEEFPTLWAENPCLLMVKKLSD